MGYPDQDWEEAVELLQEVIDSHCEHDSCYYNECDIEPCNWCVRAKIIIEG